MHRRPSGQTSALTAEWLMGAAVLASLAWAVWFFLEKDYLPQPFLWIVSDSLMDWHNPAYWAHNPGAYDAWRSVYPPFSFAFLKIFSNSACYATDPFVGRNCDRWGQIALFGFYLLNAWLLYRHYRSIDTGTALLRTAVLVLGMPMLFGLERGNLIIPCFTAFILAHSRLLKHAPLRWAAHAAAINFKPYLVLTLLPLLARRRWRWFEGAGILTLLLYLSTLALVGGGTPMQILQHTRELAALQSGDSWADLYYATSYGPLARFINSAFPVIYYVGSRPVELLNLALPTVILLGQLSVVLAVIVTAVRRAPVPQAWLSGAICAMILSSSQPSAYAQIFMLFFVFMEPWRGPLRITMLVSAYLLSLTGDWIIYQVPQGPMEAWLSGSQVIPEVGVALGQFIRPGLILLIQFCFAWMCLRTALAHRSPAIPAPAAASQVLAAGPTP